MKVLVLAAGMSRRFENSGKPKVIEQFMGRPLLERVILSAKESGLTEFYVVVGHSNGEIVNSLGDGSRLGVRITYVKSEHWEKGNGYSVLAAKSALDGERFLLVMGDHQFDPNIVRRLIKTDISVGCVACVDRNIGSVYDVDEATKVLTGDGKVWGIGKDLKVFDAVDCGIFLCTGEIFGVLQECVGRGEDELSHAIALLAKRGKVKAVDVDGAFWFDIDTPADLKEAERRMLCTLCRKEDGVVSRSINRKISTRITGKLAKTGITPTQVSLISFILGIFSVPLLSTGQYPLLLAGGVVVQLASILDGCDGELARVKFLTTRHGAFLDSVMDRYVDALVILALAYGYWRVVGGTLIWFACLFALIGSFAVSYTRARYEGAFGQHLPARGIPATRDARLFLFMVGAIFNQVLPTLVVVGVLTNAEVVRRMVRCR